MTAARASADPAADADAPAGDVAHAPADTSWSGALLAALLATLEQPATWPVALAGFLARGGIVAFLLPIVVLPTPASIQTDLAPLVRPLLGGGVAPGLIVLIAAVTTLTVAWLVVGGLTGAWSDLVAIRRIAAAVDDGGAIRPARRGELWAVFAVRLLAHLPLAAALAWGSVRLFAGAYREFLTPFEVVTPLVLRIAGSVPDAIVLVVVAWLLGEAAGGLAVREIALGGRGVVGAVVHGWIGLLRRPLAGTATLGLTVLLVAVAILPGLVASATAWSRLRFLLFEGGEPGEVALALGLFVALWLGGLVLAAVATTARSAAWTAEWLRRRLARSATMSSADVFAVGTIGGVDGTDRGGWPPPGASGTL